MFDKRSLNSTVVYVFGFKAVVLGELVNPSCSSFARFLITILTILKSS